MWSNQWGKDGFFFDIVQPIPCVCYHCRTAMMAVGLDPSVEADRLQWGAETSARFKRDMTAVVKSLVPTATVFDNAGHVAPRDRRWR
jgi:hypothetical protein